MHDALAVLLLLLTIGRWGELQFCGQGGKENALFSTTLQNPQQCIEKLKKKKPSRAHFEAIK